MRERKVIRKLEEKYQHEKGPEKSKKGFRLFAREDQPEKGRLCGHPIPCRICGATDEWEPEGRVIVDGKETDTPRNFKHSHGRVEYFPIENKDTVKTKEVGKAER